ncbi:MAG: RnfABCDGE type electron transport complex subunit D [Spongiibacteraceae bacterium]
MNRVAPDPSTLITASAPHAHDRSSVDNIMLNVCGALIPTTAFGFYLFGWPAFNLFFICCASAVATEALCLRAINAPFKRLRDSSALLTGWLLALSLPPWAPWWIALGGAAFAIAIGKQLYGGIGQNPFNPAMLARVALLISFPVQMTTWVNVTPALSASAPDFVEALRITFNGIPDAMKGPDGITGATALGHLRTALTLHKDANEIIAQDFDWHNALVGTTRGSLGETSEILVLIGGAWLLYKRIISWHIPVAMLAALGLSAGFFHLMNPALHGSALFHLTSGGIMLGAFFIATDFVTSPASNKGKLIFGAGCGIVTYIIRSWAGFPEGVAFAVLFMNALTPLIDRYFKPRIFGRDHKGEPLPLPSSRGGPNIS